MLNHKKLITKILDALKGWGITTHGCSNGSSVAITIPSSSRGFFFCGSTGVAKTAIYAVGANSSGAAAGAKLAEGSGGSGLTLTSGTNKITVANNTGAYLTVFYLNLGGGYCLNAIFSRLAERWWEYVEHKETAHVGSDSVHKSIMFRLQHCNPKRHLQNRRKQHLTFTRNYWVVRRDACYELRQLIHRAVSDRSKYYNTGHVLSWKNFFGMGCMEASGRTDLTIFGRGWSCA